MKTKFAACIMVVVSFFLVASARAWDGYDYENGSYVDIEKGNLVRSGNDIEIYDYGTGSYKDVEVQSIDRQGSTVEIEVTDSETGENRTFEMDDN
jgi:pyruvate/2-oxoglutarate/acetoin dehydrogenase E1 component